MQIKTNAIPNRSAIRLKGAMLSNVQFVGGKAVIDGHIITGQAPGAAYEFAFKILEATGHDIEELKNKLMF